MTSSRTVLLSLRLVQPEDAFCRTFAKSRHDLLRYIINAPILFVICVTICADSRSRRQQEPDLSVMIKACGTLVIYIGFAPPFFEALFSGRILVALTILGFAHLIARAFSALIT